MASHSKTTILDLPHELLDKIFDYLAWHPEDSIVPSNPDITNISLCCRTLRAASLPTLFRNVRLWLRWDDGAIVEPGLSRLRGEAYEISKLVRRVHIETQFGQEPAWQSKPFTTAQALRDWTAENDSGGSGLGLAHRKRIRDVALELYGPQEPPDSTTSGLGNSNHILREFFGSRDALQGQKSQKSLPASDISTEQANTIGAATAIVPSRAEEAAASSDPPDERDVARKARLQLDALIACMVTLPPQVHTLIFDAQPADRHDKPKFDFALQIFSMALRIFEGRLQSLTVAARSLSTTRALGLPYNAPLPPDVLDTALTPAIASLHSVTSLTLASTTGMSDRLSRHSLDAIRASTWKREPLCSNVTHLSLRNIVDKRSGFFDLIKGFKSLADLTISDIKLGPDMGVGFNRQTARAPSDPLWLLFLISIRIHRPSMRIYLGKLYQWHNPDTLPVSAVKWLAEEAVPVGANVDFERETRLTEDFGSFMDLWIADDSEVGGMARTDEGLGKLVDDAFSSRWKTFAHLR